MSKRTSSPKFTLPRTWPCRVRSALLHVVALAQYATAHTRSWAAESCNTRVRLRATVDQIQQEIALLQAEIRIKDARMTCVPAHRRPYYPPVVRLEILQLRAARGWSLEQTADAFLVTAATIRSWTIRLEETGPTALVQLRTPVNKFPDFVRYAVQQLQRPSTQCSCSSNLSGRNRPAEGLGFGPVELGRMASAPTHTKSWRRSMRHCSKRPVPPRAARHPRRISRARRGRISVRINAKVCSTPSVV